MAVDERLNGKNSVTYVTLDNVDNLYEQGAQAIVSFIKKNEKLNNRLLKYFKGYYSKKYNTQQPVSPTDEISPNIVGIDDVNPDELSYEPDYGMIGETTLAPRGEWERAYREKMTKMGYSPSQYVYLTLKIPQLILENVSGVTQSNDIYTNGKKCQGEVYVSMNSKDGVLERRYGVMTISVIFNEKRRCLEILNYHQNFEGQVKGAFNVVEFSRRGSTVRSSATGLKVCPVTNFEFPRLLWIVNNKLQGMSIL